MSFRLCSGALLVLLCASVSAEAQSVQLSFENGTVSLSARNAPVRAILAEWARLGGTHIVNGDRMAGPPVTVELVDVPEREALEVLLRDASGYMIAGSQAGSGAASTVGRVMILPTSSTPYNPPPAPGFVQPPPLPDFPDFEAQDPDEIRFRVPRDFVPPQDPAGVPMPAQPYQPDPPGAPTSRPGTQPPSSRPGPTIPGTASRPGEIVPVPESPEEEFEIPDGPRIDDEP